MELLLSVEHCFMITGRDLVVTPDLALPHDKHSCECAVIVERPDGTRLPAKAELRYEHFRPGGFKLMVYLPGPDESDVPVGSKVWRV